MDAIWIITKIHVRGHMEGHIGRIDMMYETTCGFNTMSQIISQTDGLFHLLENYDTY